ncbi:hypothetical protein NQ317_001473 [Molorchus minor]|uniref:Integrase catalytic domain-containing protein n=1 Tax=Molorchus minor TaxID=1323400 RepID=A0ABQ9JVV3_9CUCU|nr:hypothetical protein NQ317_001473 [Molorchus minor]
MTPVALTISKIITDSKIDSHITDATDKVTNNSWTTNDDSPFYPQDYKKEIMAYIMMYNVTPHGTTGKSPSELLFNRRIRDKIPGLEDITADVMDEEVYDQDLTKKEMGRRREDKSRNATIGVDEVKPGDKVLVKNTFLTPNFDNSEYDVLGRNGNEVTLFGKGKVIKRNVAHIKKLPVNKTSPETSTTPAPPLTPARSTPHASPLLQDDPAEKTKNAGDDQEISVSAQPQITPLKLVREGGMWRPAAGATNNE